MLTSPATKTQAQLGQSEALKQGNAHVPLLSPTLPVGQHVPFEQLPLQHGVPLEQGTPSGAHPGVVLVEVVVVGVVVVLVVLLVVVVVVVCARQLPPEQFLLQH